jgi:hypothetical protein
MTTRYPPGTQLRVRADVSSATHRYVPPHFVPSMDLSPVVTVVYYSDRWVHCLASGVEYTYDPEWLVPNAKCPRRKHSA